MNQKKLPRKKFLKEFVPIVDRWLQENEGVSQAAQVVSLRDTLSRLQDEKLLFDEQQNLLKGRLGRARDAGESPADLISQMKQSAGKLKSLNSAVIATADSLLAILEADKECVLEKPTEMALPGHFRVPLWVGTGTDQSAPVSGWQVSEDITVDQWNHYVSKNSQATHYHQIKWREIIEKNFSQQHWFVCVLNESGGIEGVMAMVQMSGPVSGHYLLSVPWLIYGGSLASNRAASDLLADYAKEKVSELNCNHVELRQIHARSDWQLVPGKAAMVLSLPPTIEALNSGFKASLRSQILGAAAHHPSIEFGGSELIDEFYEVFCEKMRDLGTPVYHKGFFDDIARTFPESTTVVVVRLHGKAVASAILIKHRDTVEIPWAVARKKYNRQSVNMYMYHQILEYVVTQGFQFFDFGRSTIDTGTYQFKKQWGARPISLGWHRFPSSVPESDEHPESGKSWKFEVAIAVWKRLPVWVTKIIGPPLSRQLPW